MSRLYQKEGYIASFIIKADIISVQLQCKLTKRVKSSVIIKNLSILHNESMLKTVMLLNIFEETIHFFQDSLVNRVQKNCIYLK